MRTSSTRRRRRSGSSRWRSRAERCASATRRGARALLRAMAYVEASLDFSDEGDIAEGAFNAALPEVRSLIAELGRALADGRRGEIVREGIQVAIVGAPNAGKSSLLERACRPRGRHRLRRAGHHARYYRGNARSRRLSIRVPRYRRACAKPPAPSSEEGVRRALAAAEDADVVLGLIDASAPHPVLLPMGEGTLCPPPHLAESRAERATAPPLPGGEGLG